MSSTGLEPVRAEPRRGAVARVLAVALGIVAVGALPCFLTGSLAPEMRRDFALGDAALGLVIGVYFVASAFGSALAGRLVARIGTAAAIRLTTALAAVCGVGVAALASSAVALAGLLVIGGLSNALASPAASSLLTRELAAERHGLGYGALTAGAPVASLLAGLALPLLAHPVGWRASFVVTAGIAALLAVAGGQGGDSAPVRVSGGSAPHRRHLPARGLDAVYVLAIAAALASAASTGLISFLVVFSIEEGLSADAAGALLAATGLAAAVSRIGLGAIADRIAGRAGADVLALFAVSALGLLLLLSGSPALIVVGGLMAAGVGWGWTGLLNLMAVREGRFNPEEAVGITMSGVFVGALIGPILVGFVAEGAGFDAAWLTTIGFLVVAAGAVGVASARSGARIEPRA